jgi:uncharacterized protein (TIGR04551 family)
MSRLARVAPILALGATLGLAARDARATGFTDIGEDIVPRVKTDVQLHGYFRVRGEALDNLDLDRGLTPSGQPLFPVSLGDPNAQTLTYADMRLRTDLAVYAPGGMVAVKARIDTLDDQPLGGSYVGAPAATTTQGSPLNAFRIKRAWGEALTPIGLLAAGRMGNQWGLGILANGGDCADCDSGDAADRVAFISPVLQHIVAVAYDFSATGPFVPRADGVRFVDLEPQAAVQTVTFAFLKWQDDLARHRRRAAGKATIEYGAYVSHRWQSDDVPVTYLATTQPVALDASQVMSRGYTATAIDGWARLTLPFARVEAEWAFLFGQVDQPSLVPGVFLHTPVTANQMGGALESEVAPPNQPFGAGLDAGYASGDPAPGMGAFPKVGAPAAKPGDLNGPQANPPFDTTINNFTFHPDYRIDRILFREIIGAVTDAVYLRPHARVNVLESAPGVLSASVAGIASWAVYATSTPGGRSPLGVEIDPTLAYASRDGFGVALEYAALFPLAGLDNPVAHLDARPAQLARVRLMYTF